MRRTEGAMPAHAPPPIPDASAHSHDQSLAGRSWLPLTCRRDYAITPFSRRQREESVERGILDLSQTWLILPCPARGAKMCYVCLAVWAERFDCEMLSVNRIRQPRQHLPPLHGCSNGFRQ